MLRAKARLEVRCVRQTIQAVVGENPHLPLASSGAGSMRMMTGPGKNRPASRPTCEDHAPIHREAPGSRVTHQPEKEATKGQTG